MGTYYSYAQGQDFKSYVADELKNCRDVVKYSIVGSCAYILYGRASGQLGIEVWKLDRWEGCPGHKPMAEEMHPYYYDCPKHILDAAGPPPNDDARRWREECHAKRQRVNQVRQLKVGDIIETDGNGVYTVRHYRDRRGRAKKAYYCHTRRTLYRLPRLADRPFRTVKLKPETLFLRAEPSRANHYFGCLIQDDSRAPGPGVWWIVCNEANSPYASLELAKQAIAYGSFTLRRYSGE